MKKMLSLILAALTLLSLTACQSNEEPPEAPSAEREESPYADANTDTDRYYMAITGNLSGIVYQDDFYYCSPICSIISVPLSGLLKNNIMSGSGFRRADEINILCADPLCGHRDLSCPTMMRDPFAQFLIDATESNGGPAVIYYHRATSETWEEDGSITVHGSEIVRFDVAEGEAKQVIFSDQPIKQLMSYGDRLYYITQNSDDTYQINTVKKTGGEATALSAGDGYLRLIGANKDGVYANDHKGNVYAFDPASESVNLVYTVAEVYPIIAELPADLEMFIDKEYLYFFADFEVLTYPYGTDVMPCIKHSIRRVKLSEPVGEGEVVADAVFEDLVYGIYNGVLYYGPYDVIIQVESDASPIACTQGTIKGVRLDTLETFDVVTDCGLDFSGANYYINDRCIIGTMYPYRHDFNDYRYDDAGYAAMLYGFENGDLYCVCASPSVLPQ